MHTRIRTRIGRLIAPGSGRGLAASSPPESEAGSAPAKPRHTPARPTPNSRLKEKLSEHRGNPSTYPDPHPLPHRPPWLPKRERQLLCSPSGSWAYCHRRQARACLLELPSVDGKEVDCCSEPRCSEKEDETNTQEEGQPAKTEWLPGFEFGKAEGSLHAEFDRAKLDLSSGLTVDGRNLHAIGGLPEVFAIPPYTDISLGRTDLEILHAKPFALDFEVKIAKGFLEPRFILRRITRAPRS